MSKLVKLAMRVRYGKCTLDNFLNTVKLTLETSGHMATKEEVKKVAIRAMVKAKEAIGS